MLVGRLASILADEAFFDRAQHFHPLARAIFLERGGRVANVAIEIDDKRARTSCRESRARRCRRRPRRTAESADHWHDWPTRG